MDRALKKTMKLVSELLNANSCKHFDKKRADCSTICIKNDQVTFAFKNDSIEFYGCSNTLDRTVVKSLYNIINIYLKALNTINNQNCLSPVATHELKGMLSAAKLSIEMLTKYDFDSEDRAKLLSQSFDSVTKSIDIFEEMLQIERFQHQTHEHQIEISECNIIETIAKNINTLEPSIKTKNLNINFDERQICIIQGSDFWLDRALFNLLNNAIKYNIENGYIKITVSAADKSSLTIKIQNSSLGINEDEKEKLFEKFTTTKNSEHIGTGIGLALVKAVVDAHDGNIKLQNFNNSDVAFVLTLPLVHHKKSIQNPYASLAAVFVAVLFGTSYFFPVIPTFNDTQTKGKFDIIKTQNGSIIRVESNADYSFWNFRNIAHSKSYKRFSLSGGYAEAELKGDVVHFVMPSNSFTNLGTKVAFEKDKNSAVSIYEGGIKLNSKTIEEGFGFSTSKNGNPKTVQLLDAPYGIQYKNLTNGSVQIIIPPIKEAKTYKLIIAKDKDFEDIINIYRSTTPTINTTINKDGYYYIKVMAVDKNGINGYQNSIRIKNRYNIIKAEEMIKAKAFNKAIAYAQQSNRDFKRKDFEPYSELGWIYYLKGEYAKSIQALDKALKRNPNNEKDLIHIARDYYFLKETERAKKIYFLLLSKNNTHQDALWGLAEVYLAKEQTIQAKEILNKLRSLNPKYYMLNYDLARVALVEGEKEKAVSYLQKEIELYSNQSGDAQKLLSDIEGGNI